MYVADCFNQRVQSFQLPSKTGTPVITSAGFIVGIHSGKDTLPIYATSWGIPGRLFRWPPVQTLPVSGTQACNASGGWTSRPYGIAGDQYGNIYVSQNDCHTIVKWTPNSTVPILFAGTGASGSSPLQLSAPRHMFLDERNSFLYVADTDNHRVQRFSLSGNGTGVTVAGGNGNGTAAKIGRAHV